MASRHVAAVNLLLLDTCVSYQAGTSRIVHQSYTATYLAILIHKSEIKVRSGYRTGRSVDDSLRDPQISAQSMDSCAN